MKDSRKIVLRLTTVFFLLTASTSLSGCVIYDAIMWAPRKLWGATGDKVFGVHNEQQTEMGPRRKPSGNPQGGAAAPGLPAMPRGNIGGTIPPTGNYPPGYPSQNNLPPQTYSEFDGSTNSALNPYGNPGTLQQQNPGANQLPGTGAGYPPTPPMPPIPPAYQQPYTGVPKQIQPITGDLQPPDMTDISDPDGGADAAYARGGGGGAGAKKKGWRIPFFSGNHKMERQYEPLSAEFVIAKGDDITPESGTDEEYVNSTDSVLPRTLPGNKAIRGTENLNKEKSRKNSSMFPLDKYAPVPSATVQKIENKDNTYPKLGRVPERPLNLDSPATAATEMDNMTKEAADAEAKKASIHNLPSNGVGTGEKTTEVQKQTPKPEAIDSKTAESEAPLLKRRKHFQSSKESGKEPVAVAPEALKNDAILMDDIADTQKGSQLPTKEQEEKKGFFASLHDKIFKPSPKKIWRKSEPPVAKHRNIGDSDEPVVEQNLPAFNMPDNIISHTIPQQPPIPEAVIQPNSNTLSGKNYGTDTGSLLPKSRYTDRRKVPQHD